METNIDFCKMKVVIIAGGKGTRIASVAADISGYDGGKLKQIAHHGVHIPVNDMQITEDLHMVLDHGIMSILSSHLGF